MDKWKIGDVGLTSKGQKFLILSLFSQDVALGCVLVDGMYLLKNVNPLEGHQLSEIEKIEFIKDLHRAGMVYERGKGLVREGNHRDEEISEAALEYTEELNDPQVFSAFVEGALWSDKNPESRYNLSEPDRMKVYLDSIVTDSERMTTGNMEHHRASIRNLAKVALKLLEEIE